MGAIEHLEVPKPHKSNQNWEEFYKANFANIIPLGHIPGPTAPNLKVSISWKFAFCCFIFSPTEQSV